MTAKQADSTKSARVTVVQVPGATAANTQASTAAMPAPADNPADAETLAETLRAENEALRAQIAAADRVVARVAAKGHAHQQVHHRGDYLTMRATEVDSTTLTKSVLTQDGWVVPPTITQAK